MTSVVAECRTGQVLPRPEEEGSTFRTPDHGRDVLATTYGIPVAKVPTVPRPALSYGPESNEPTAMPVRATVGSPTTGG